MLRSSKRRKEKEAITTKNNTNLNWEDDSTMQGSTLSGEERERLHSFSRDSFTYSSAKMDPPNFVRSEGSIVSLAASSIKGEESMVGSVKEARSTMQSHAFWSQLEVQSDDDDEEKDDEFVNPGVTSHANSGVTSHVRSAVILPEWNEADKVPKKIGNDKLDAEEMEDGDSYAAKFLEFSATVCSYPTQLVQTLESGFMDYCGDRGEQPTQPSQSARQPQSNPTYHKAEAVAAIQTETTTTGSVTTNTSPPLSITIDQTRGNERNNSRAEDEMIAEEVLSRASGMSSTWSQSQKNIYLLALARKAQQRAVSTDNKPPAESTRDVTSLPTENSATSMTPIPIDNNTGDDDELQSPQSNGSIEEDIASSNNEAADHYRSTERFVPISSSPVGASSTTSPIQAQSPLLIRPEPRLSNVSEDVEEHDSDEVKPVRGKESVNGQQASSDVSDLNPASISVTAQEDDKHGTTSKSSAYPFSKNKSQGIPSQRSVASSSASVSSTRSGIRKRLSLKKSKQWQELNSDDEGQDIPHQNDVREHNDETSISIDAVENIESDDETDPQSNSATVADNTPPNHSPTLPTSLSALGLSPSDESGRRQIYATDDCSLATYHTSQTAQSSASQWSVAGRERYLRAVKANESNARVGWMDSMQKASTKSGYSWNPEKGWIDLPSAEKHISDSLGKKKSVVDLDEFDDNSIGSSVYHLSPSIRAMIQKKRLNKGKDRKVTFAPEPVKVQLEKCSEEDKSLFEEESGSESEYHHKNEVNENYEASREFGSSSGGSLSDSSNHSSSARSRAIKHHELHRKLLSKEVLTDEDETRALEKNEIVITRSIESENEEIYSEDEYHEDDLVVSRTNDLISRLEEKEVDAGHDASIVLPKKNESRLSYSLSEEKSVSVANATQSSISRQSLSSKIYATNVSAVPTKVLVSKKSHYMDKTQTEALSKTESKASSISWPSQNLARAETILVSNNSGVKAGDWNKSSAESSDLKDKGSINSRNMPFKKSTHPPSIEEMDTFSFDASTVSTNFTAVSRKRSSLKVDIPTSIDNARDPRRSPQSNVARKSPNSRSEANRKERKSPSMLERLNCAMPIPNCNANDSSFSTTTTSNDSLPIAHLKFMTRNSPTTNMEETTDRVWIPSMAGRCGTQSIVPIAEETSFDASEFESSVTNSYGKSFDNENTEESRRELKVPQSISEDSLSTNVGGSKASEYIGMNKVSEKAKVSFKSVHQNTRTQFTNESYIQEAPQSSISRNTMSHHTSSSSPTTWQLLLAKRASQKLADQQTNQAKRQAEIDAAAKVEEMMHAISLRETNEVMEDKRSSQKKRLEEIVSKKHHANRDDEKLRVAEKSAALVVEDMMKQFNFD